MPPISTRRVEISIKKRTINRFKPVGVHTSIVKKSDATICSQCRGEKFFPRCLSASLRRGLNTVILQNVGDRVACQFVTQVGQGTLYSQITPGLALCSETD